MVYQKKKNVVMSAHKTEYQHPVILDNIKKKTRRGNSDKEIVEELL